MSSSAEITSMVGREKRRPLISDPESRVIQSCLIAWSLGLHDHSVEGTGGWDPAIWEADQRGQNVIPELVVCLKDRFSREAFTAIGAQALLPVIQSESQVG